MPRLSRVVGRIVLVAVGMVLPIGVVEVGVRLRESNDAAPVRDVDTTADYYTRHDILGYAPSAGARSTVIRRHGAETIYSVTYTIGDDGLRISPASRSPNASDCALFFGDSFTYGEGVNDREAMPYVVGVSSGYQVYNFGFHGYGPHQMLAAVERGLVSRVVHCDPRIVVYQAVVDHAWRAAGAAFWDTHGPKFVLGKDGPAYAGHFDDVPAENTRLRIHRALASASHAYRRYVASRVTDEDIRLFVAIVVAARARLHVLYPSATFHMILWDTVPGDSVLRKEVDALQHAGIPLHLASEILPGYPKNRLAYQLSAFDEHPTAGAQRLVANFVVTRFLSR